MRCLTVGAIVVLGCALTVQAAPYWTENFEAGIGAWTVDVTTAGAVAPTTDAAPIPKGNSLHIPDGLISRISRPFDASADDVIILRYLFYTNDATAPGTQRYFGGFMSSPFGTSNTTLVRIGANNQTTYRLHYGAPVTNVDTGVPVSVVGWHTVEIKLTFSTQTIEWKLDRASGSVVHAALVRPTAVVLGYNFTNGTAGAPDTSVWYDNVWIGPAADASTFNLPPIVDAGPDQNTNTTGSKNISGSVNDDGLVAAVTNTWSQISGPAVTFGDASQLSTTVNCPSPGTYVLRLTSYDGELTRWDDMRILVNTAPTVDAGADAGVTLPASANLDGTVTDDGLPIPPAAVTTVWSKDSGPGTVTFGDAAQVDTTASFSLPGVYVLRLTANDGSLSSSDTVTITVSGAGQNPVLQTAVSRKNHAAGGDLDIDVKVAGAVECRAKGAPAVPGATQLVVGFDIPIQLTLGDPNSVVLSSGTVSSLVVSGSQLTVNMSGATQNAPLTVTFPGVADANSASNVTTGSLCFVNVVGDVNGTDRVANIFDLVAVRNVLNQAATGANFRSDVNADGTINIFDLVAVRNNLNLQSVACP